MRNFVVDYSVAISSMPTSFSMLKIATDTSWLELPINPRGRSFLTLLPASRTAESTPHWNSNCRKPVPPRAWFCIKMAFRRLLDESIKLLLDRVALRRAARVLADMDQVRAELQAKLKG
jgi:hypothetical protein